ncbi:hypothetical protein U1Q18_004837 [Sarracenia purpurea var. burkii]
MACALVYITRYNVYICVLVRIFIRICHACLLQGHSVSLCKGKSSSLCSEAERFHLLLRKFEIASTHQIWLLILKVAFPIHFQFAKFSLMRTSFVLMKSMCT